jgi:hypothetical protein
MKENEYKYTTIEVINMLKEDETRVFEYPVPNHIGIIRLVKTNDGICFSHIDDGRNIKGNPIGLSQNHLNMIWKEIFE